MQQIADQEFNYLGLGTFPSVCRLCAFEIEDAPTVVIATEVAHNPGTSVTNAAQDIAAQAYQWLERPAQGITLIEHYEKDGEERYAQERFSLVTFQHTEGGRFSGPDWRSITKEEVERMVGQVLNDEVREKRAEPLKHEQLTADAQFSEVEEKVEYLRAYANTSFENDQTLAAMAKWLHQANALRSQTNDQTNSTDEATQCLSHARNLYFDLYPVRRAVEEQLIEDHHKAQGKEITVYTFSVWRSGAKTFDDVALEFPIRATVQNTDVLTFSWDSSDGENEAFCVPVWRVTPREFVPEAEGATFLGVSGIHRSVNGRTFDPAQSEEPEYTWIR